MRQPASDDGVRVYLQEENGNVRVAIGSTVLGVVADYVLTDEEAYYELEAYSHAVSGFVALYRDGAEIWSYTGDTSGMGDVSRMIIRSASYSGTEYLYARDFYCCGLSAWDAVGGNNLGPCQVHSAPVDAAVGTPDFTPSAGNNEDNLPIPHNVDVTYNQSNTNDHEDRFTVDLSARPAGTIFAAGVELAVKQAVAGSTEIRSTMSINSVRTTGAKYLPAAAYEVCLSDITQSPGSLTDLDYIGYQNQAG